MLNSTDHEILMSMTNFIVSLVEHEKSFIISRQGHSISNKCHGELQCLHWNEALSGHFSIFIFSDLALMLMKWILTKYVPFNGLKLSGAWKSFLSLYTFLVQKCKN